MLHCFAAGMWIQICIPKKEIEKIPLVVMTASMMKRYSYLLGQTVLGLTIQQ